MFFFFKQKTAYEVRISDWSSDVCSPDLILARRCTQIPERRRQTVAAMLARRAAQRPQGILQPLRQRDITLAAQDHMGMRSEERRVGKECVRTCRSRWWTYH